MEHPTHPQPSATLAEAAQQAAAIEPAYWVTLYRIALCYGGDEEGGWWYTTREALVSLPIPASTEEAQTQIEAQQVSILIAEAEKIGETLGATYRARNPYAERPLEGCGLFTYPDGETRPLRSYRSAAPEISAEIVAEDIAAESHDTERPRYE